jgi:hypothetical protein
VVFFYSRRYRGIAAPRSKPPAPALPLEVFDLLVGKIHQDNTGGSPDSHAKSDAPDLGICYWVCGSALASASMDGGKTGESWRDSPRVKKRGDGLTAVSNHSTNEAKG